MGFFGGDDIAAALARLVSSPRVQYIGKQLSGTAQRQGAGPFRVPSSSGMGNRPTGSYPNIGASVNNIAQRAAQLGRGAQIQ